ncbi:MAG: hypothetical protein RMK74_10670 [Myxococcales bacterium]|nr:hypothetical protein [Myxococcales bacterium]
MAELPPCGLYRTTREVAGVPAGRLVYFHNHGEPGPGIYLPSGWRANRATWHARGHLLASPQDAYALEPLEPEGFYVVTEPFACCERRCRLFETDALVQIGYDAQAEPILFEPEWTERGLGLPDRGVRIDRDRLSKLRRVRVRTPRQDPSVAEHVSVH